MVNYNNDWVQQAYYREFVKPKLSQDDFYYNEDGRVVFTEQYHKRRGYCCGSGCLHCPFSPKHQKGNTKL